MHSILSILATIATITSALPTGAPRCKITEKIISQGHLATQNGAMGLTMSAPPTYTPGGPAIPITITGSFPVDMGILGYVTPGGTQDSILTGGPNGPAAGASRHVGGFMDAMLQGIRPQTQSTCDAQNVINDMPESTITHMAPLLGFRNTMTLMWTPPVTNEGVVTVNMVIAGNVLEPYMILPSVQMMSTDGLLQGQTMQFQNANAAAPLNPLSYMANAATNLVPNILQLPGTVVDDVNTLLGDGEAITHTAGNLAGGMAKGMAKAFGMKRDEAPTFPRAAQK
ncbi:hypothetical protein BC830DRAFT_1142992 [Chytriomyces sp. MP71]|nr:hypothetical protein BC830DRAFT_1142992 [Chytriomyces sp. MP71]